MEKELILDYIESYDDYGELRGQEVSNDEENVEALNRGIELAKKGYSKVILGEAQKDDE